MLREELPPEPPPLEDDERDEQLALFCWSDDEETFGDCSQLRFGISA